MIQIKGNGSGQGPHIACAALVQLAAYPFGKISQTVIFKREMIIKDENTNCIAAALACRLIRTASPQR
jgi:hypothetical protein